MGSDPLTETDLAGNTNNANFYEYVFFGGKRIACHLQARKRTSSRWNILTAMNMAAAA